MTPEARGDFWSIQGDFIYRHHNEPRVQLYVPKGETLLVPLKDIDVIRTTPHQSGCVAREVLTIIGMWTRIEVYQIRDICGPRED